MRGLLFLAVGVLSACSAIVGGPANQMDPLPCYQAEGDPNPCRTGERCVEGLCLPDNTCVPECVAPEVCIGGACRPAALEVCNGLDDNGNDAIDEGLRNDEDADGFFTCDTDTTRVDCVDRRGPVGASIYPGAPEICDGYDNDCNPATLDGSGDGDCDTGPEGTEVCAEPVGGGAPECLLRRSCRLSGCGATEFCDTTTGMCVPDVPPTDCTMAGMGCRAGERCNTTTLLCEPIRELPIGELCGSDAECASHACYSWAALDLPQTPPALGRCGAPCCTSASCSGLGADLVCWAPGSGARSCMPRSVAGEAADAPVCTRRSDCGSQTCRLSSVSGTTSTFSAFTCGPPAGTAAVDCTVDADCIWGICLAGTCSIPCGRQSDCSVYNCRIPLICDQVGVCAYVNRGDDWVTACLVNDPDRQPNGGSCTRNDDCQEVFCNPATSLCAGTCCSDADCGGLRCRPVNNFGWEMRCVPDDTIVE